MAGILDHDLIEFMDYLDDDLMEFEDYLDSLDVEDVPRLPKRYIRDRENPIEFFSEEEFYRQYKYSKDTVLNGILPIVSVGESSSNRGLPIPKLLQLLVTLRFYTTGDFQNVLGDLRGLSQSSVSRIIKDISVDIALKMKQHVKFPETEGQLEEHKAQFRQLGNFPDVVGVVDCTHVPIKNPGGQFGELYRNRKGWMSLNVQLICGPRMEILDIVSRWPGSTHDGKVFHDSVVKQRFEDGRLRGILVGDSGYSQLPYLFTPVLEQHVRNDAERRYNLAHKRTRDIIETANGVLKQRFRCLRKKLLTKMRTTQAVIVACVVLHNIGIRRNDVPELVEDEPNPVPVPNAVHNHPRGNAIRQEFIQRHFAD